MMTDIGATGSLTDVPSLVAEGEEDSGEGSVVPCAIAEVAVPVAEEEIEEEAEF